MNRNASLSQLYQKDLDFIKQNIAKNHDGSLKTFVLTNLAFLLGHIQFSSVDKDYYVAFVKKSVLSGHMPDKEGELGRETNTLNRP